MIDAHVHFWRLSRGDNALEPGTTLYRDFEPDDLAPDLAMAGVDRIVVVQAAETHAENLYTIGLAQLYPEMIAGVVAWIDLGSLSLREEIAALKATGVVKGFRPVRAGNTSIAWMADAGLAAGFAEIAAAGMTLDVLNEDPVDLPVVAELARRHPDLTIVLDHCGKPDIAGGHFEPWATDLSNLAACPNVVCKFSALLNRAAPGAGFDEIAPYAAHVVRVFGPERLLWASDWPPLTRASDYATWRRLAGELLSSLSADEQTLVTHGNAERFYRLRPSSLPSNERRSFS